ncbi:MAG: hypothetical protein ACRD0J_18505 [Acidimicrobiales bacterium]
MSLDPPPDDPGRLDGFPELAGSMEGLILHRVFRHRDPASGVSRTPFFFSTSAADSPGGGRYDLPAPDGACYMAVGKAGAWLEVFRGAGMVDRKDVSVRRLCAITVPAPIRTADLTAAQARRFGVTLEIHTTPERPLSRPGRPGSTSMGSGPCRA